MVVRAGAFSVLADETKDCSKSCEVPYSGKFSLVQAFANMPPEAPEEIFAVLIYKFCDGTTPTCCQLRHACSFPCTNRAFLQINIQKATQSSCISMDRSILAYFGLLFRCQLGILPSRFRSLRLRSVRNSRHLWLLERVCAKAVHGGWEENRLKRSSDKEPCC